MYDNLQLLLVLGRSTNVAMCTVIIVDAFARLLDIEYAHECLCCRTGVQVLFTRILPDSAVG
jgi:hypothetical protein